MVGFSTHVVSKAAVDSCVVLPLTVSLLPFFTLPTVFMPLLLLLPRFPTTFCAVFASFPSISLANGCVAAALSQLLEEGRKVLQLLSLLCPENVEL